MRSRCPRTATTRPRSSDSGAGRSSDRRDGLRHGPGGMTEPLFFKRPAGLTMGEIAALAGVTLGPASLGPASLGPESQSLGPESRRSGALGPQSLDLRITDIAP